LFYSITNVYVEYIIHSFNFQSSGGKKDKKKKKGDDFAADQEDPREPEMAVRYISLFQLF